MCSQSTFPCLQQPFYIHDYYHPVKIAFHSLFSCCQQLFCTLGSYVSARVVFLPVQFGLHDSRFWHIVLLDWHWLYSLHLLWSTSATTLSSLPSDVLNTDYWMYWVLIFSFLLKALVYLYFCFGASDLFPNLQNLSFILCLLPLLSEFHFCQEFSQFDFFFYFLNLEISGTFWRGGLFLKENFYLTYLYFNLCHLHGLLFQLLSASCRSYT